ncbi:ferredoxin reductase family protein [Arenimonas sp.]|uniref:ferredoxin reductase family protein n=1 Tax=Arenimonas sp. TaxID=1872635 RepID=UPI0025F514D1|nr:ferredoxin reductase family protein [Arenimonas sp.]
MRLNSRLLLTLLAAISVTVVLAEIPSATWASTASLSLASGVVALVFMAMASLLGSRWSWLEDLFGGLDRVYEVHKWLGVWALVLASVHLVFKAGAPEWEVASILPLPSYWTRLVRQLSYVALVVIVLLALNRKIPYGQWRWWHKLSGPLFVVVVLHWLSFKSPIALDSPAGLWLAACAALGLAGAAYKLLLYPFLARHAEYRLTRVEPGVASVRLELEPVGRGVPFEAGQFAFLRFLHAGLREPHPFTLASGGGPGQPVQFVIRALGDYTTQLVAEARPGMRAEVYAPFGRFRRPNGGDFEVWVGGGVGLSPFIAWLHDTSRQDLAKVTLFNFQTPGRGFPGVDELAADARKRGADWVEVSDGPDSAVFADRFAWLVGQVGPERISVCFCGPKGLLTRVRAEIARLGVPASKLRYEQFEFR